MKKLRGLAIAFQTLYNKMGKGDAAYELLDLLASI